MISIGVITRGKYGKRLVENIKKYSNFRVSSIELPESLPDFIESPGDFLEDLKLDKSVFSCDLVIAYTLHPDLTPEIIRYAGESGAHAVIIAGGTVHPQISGMSEKYHMHIEIHEICCDMEKCGDRVVDEFASCFGKPSFRVTTKNGLISSVEVIRGAPCGSTWHMAGALAGTKIEEAPAKAGLLIQQYPCRAVRGIRGGIHKAAEVHKKAIETALKELK